MNTLNIFLGAVSLFLFSRTTAQRAISVVSDCKSANNDSCWISSQESMYFCCSLNKALMLMQSLMREVELLLYCNAVLGPGEGNRLRSISNVTINGNNHLVTCQGQAGLSFVSSDNIFISQTRFIHCGQDFLHSNRTFGMAALSFLESSQIILSDLKVVNSTGTGVMTIDVHGNTTMTDCNLSGNVAKLVKDSVSRGGGGMLLMFTGDSLRSEGVGPPSSPFVHLRRMILTANKVVGNLNHGGALAVVIGNSSNIHIKMDDITVIDNQADLGAGVYIHLTGSSRSNVIHINNSQIQGHSCYLPPDSRCLGGAMKVELMLDSNNTLAAHNSILLESLLISKNVAYAGGGVAITTNHQFTEIAHTNKLTLKQTTFEFNCAQMGSSLHFSLSSQKNQGYLLQVTLMSINVSHSFVANNSNIVVGQAAVFVSELPVSFQGDNQFTSSKGTALILSGTHVRIERNTSMMFVGNTGKLGGALALVNEAALIAHEHAHLSFINNTANDKGGAIYISNYYDNFAYPFNGVHCAIRDSIPSRKRRAIFYFDKNYAGQQRSSVFATSVLSCQREEDENGTKKLPFCWENWEYKDSSCESEVATSPANIMVKTCGEDFMIFPGYPFSLPIDLVDDYNNTVTNRSVVTAFITSGASDDAVVVSNSQYIAGGNTIIYGEPGTNVTVAVETTGSRVVYTEMQIQFWRCPPGYITTPSQEHKNASTCSCSKIYQVDNVLICDQQAYNSTISRRWCMTYDHQLNTTIIGVWRFFTQLHLHSHNGYIQLPQHVDQLDQFFCGPLNRTGRICGECQNGTGVPVHSYDFHCVPCKKEDFYKNLAYYLTVELVPVTIFFLIVVSFNISITSGAVCMYVLYSQLITQPTEIYHMEYMFRHTFGKHGKVLLSLFLLPYSMWNLDFLRTLIPSFCLSPGLKMMHVVAMFYLSALYPLLLVVLWYTFIELHGRNCQLVVPLFSHIRKCKSRFRRNWQIRSSVIDAFATFLVLSYTKLCSVSFSLLVPNRMHDATGDATRLNLLYMDSAVEFGSVEHAPFMIIAVVIICLIIIPLPILLLVYQLPITQRWINHTKFIRQLSLSAFMDSFQGCHRDGASGGRDCRWFSCVYFVVRVVNLSITVASDTIFLERILQMIVAVMLILALAVIQPYKKTYYTLVDIFILCLMILLLSYGLTPWTTYIGSDTFTIPFTIGLFVPFVYILAYVTYQILSRVCYRARNHTGVISWFQHRARRPNSVLSRISSRYRSQTNAWSALVRNCSNSSLDDSMPHRLLYPEDYSNSLQEQAPLLGPVNISSSS